MKKWEEKRKTWHLTLIFIEIHRKSHVSHSIVAHTAKTTTTKAAAAAHNKNNGMAIKNWIKKRRRRLPNWVSRNNGSSNRNILIQFKRKFPIHPEKFIEENYFIIFAKLFKTKILLIPKMIMGSEWHHAMRTTWKWDHVKLEEKFSMLKICSFC